MGTRNVKGDGKSNKVTISRSGGENVAPRKVDPDTGKTDRSFAQPNPSVQHPAPQAKDHATAADAVEALERNSRQGRSYSNPVVDDALDGDDSDAE